jgi:hypothetical protein
MPRIVKNTLLHVVFKSKEYDTNQKFKPDFYYKFLIKTYPDGVSFFEDNLEHSKLIE